MHGLNLCGLVERWNYSIIHYKQGAQVLFRCAECLRYGVLMAKQVRLTVAKAIAKANLRRAEAGEKPITMNAIVTGIGVAATTITHLA